MGVHHLNRGGYGLDERHVHTLAQNITDVGFAYQATDPHAIEDDAQGKNREFTHDLTKMSAKLATLNATQFASLANGHTNHLLCCILAGVECDIPELSTNGKMCKAKVVGKCPSIERFLNEGLTWKIFRAKVADMYPSFAKHAQAALNTQGNVQQAMGEFAVLVDAANKAAEQQKAHPDKDVDWKAIVRQIAVQKTTVPSDGISELCNYVRKWGGGKAGFFVRVLHKFHICLGKLNRRVHPDFFGCLASVQLQIECWTPHLVTAIVMAQAFCREDAVKESLCRFITHSEVNALFKKTATIIVDAEARLKDCYLLMENTPLTQHHRCLAYSKFSGAVVRLLMVKKPVPNTCIESMQHDFVEDLKRLAATEGHTEMPSALESNPFKSEPEPNEPTARSSAPTARSSVDQTTTPHPANFVQYDSRGNLEMDVQQGLEGCGYKPGVLLKKDGVVCKIDSVATDGALCVHPVDRSWNTNPEAAWSISRLDIKLWQITDPPENMHGIQCVAAPLRFTSIGKAIIVIANGELLVKNPLPLTRLQYKPKWGVFAMKDYKTGSMVMVFSTCNVASIEETAATMNDPMVCKYVSPIDTLVHKLVPHCTKEHVCATWRVACTDQEEHANMQHDHRTVDVGAGMTGATKRQMAIKSVELPVLVNYKDVTVGDELLVFRPKAEKKRAADEPARMWADSAPSTPKAQRRGGA